MTRTTDKVEPVPADQAPAPKPPDTDPPVDLPKVPADRPAADSAHDLKERLRISLLTVIADAVDATTVNGVDIVLAGQAADVYDRVFGKGDL